MTFIEKRKEKSKKKKFIIKSNFKMRDVDSMCSLHDWIDYKTSTQFLMIKIAHYSQRIIRNNYSSKCINVFAMCSAAFFILFLCHCPARPDFCTLFCSLQTEATQLEDVRDKVAGVVDGWDRFLMVRWNCLYYQLQPSSKSFRKALKMLSEIGLRLLINKHEVWLNQL